MTLCKLRKKVLLDLAVPLAKDVFSKLATKSTSSVLNKFEKKKKKTRQGTVRTGRGFILFISNDDIDDIIKIVESLEKSVLLIDGANETLKHEIKKQEGEFIPAMMAIMAASFIAPIASSLIQPIVSSLINSITGKRQEGGFLPFLALPLMIKVLENGVKREGRGYVNKNF